MLVAVLLAAFVRAGDVVPVQAVDLVVHEWGTFTTAQAADGRVLEGLHHEEETLPHFVHQMDQARQVDLGLARRKGLARGVRGVTVKMETPVTYFYAPRSMQVRARVELRHGLLTQWFPWAEASERLGELALRLDPHGFGLPRIDFVHVHGGALAWEFELLAPRVGSLDVPALEPGAPWEASRIPSANHLRTVGPRRGDAAAALETEEFLFYRGLARFDLPLRARTSRDGVVELTNTSAEGDEVAHLVVLHMRDGRAAFATARRLEPGSRAMFRVPLTSASAALDDVLPLLAHTLQSSLASTGLSADEARALVETWKRSYFTTEGLRVLYVLPQRFTDHVLPLEITPQPRETVRVLVGRLECLTPEVEREVEDALHQFAHAPQSARTAIWERIQRHARLLEPILRAIEPRVTDAQAREQLEAWLGQLD